MIKVEIKGMRELQAQLRGLSGEKIKKARIASLNDAAFVGYQAGRDELKRVFDRPTPKTLSSIAYWKAGEAGKSVREPGVFDIRGKGLSLKLSEDRMFSRIDLSGDINKQGIPAEYWLSPGIIGGPRRYKRHEIALNRIGILPPGMFIVPGEGADMDAYGNMSSGQIVQIIAYFRAFGEQGYKANMTEKTRARLAKGTKTKQAIEYFVVKPESFRTWGRGNGKAMGRKKMQPGIYKRIFFGMGTAIKPVMIFVKSPQYGRRFDFYRVTIQAAERQLYLSLDKYLNQMLEERGL